MDTKERLLNVLKALMQLEVKGENTIIVADVLRELDNIIATWPEGEEENVDTRD